MTRTLLTLCLFSSIAAAQVFTVCRDDDNLREIDPATGATLVSTPLTGGVGGFNGVAVDPTTSTVYAVLNDGIRTLATIDQMTNTVSNVGSMGDQVAGIAFDASGLLYAVTGDGAGSPEMFFSVDKVTGVMTPISALGNGADGETIGTDATGNLFHGSGGFADPQVLEAVNAMTGATTPVPLTGFVGCEWTSVNASSAGGFYATGRGANEFVTVTSTGTVALVGILDHTAKGVFDAGVTITPCNGLYPGTPDDYLLLAGANGALQTCSQQTIMPGDILDVHISSPSGGLLATPPVITGQFFATGTTAPFIPITSPTEGIWVDPFANPGPFIVYDGQANPFGGLGLPPQGLGFQFLVGPGLTGVSCMLNCFTITPSAANNIFAATEGLEIQFL